MTEQKQTETSLAIVIINNKGNKELALFNTKQLQLFNEETSKSFNEGLSVLAQAIGVNEDLLGGDFVKVDHEDIHLINTPHERNIVDMYVAKKAFSNKQEMDSFIVELFIKVEDSLNKYASQDLACHLNNLVSIVSKYSKQ